MNITTDHNNNDDISNGLFTGFSKKSTDFLRDLTLNNNRDWFKENKYDYDNYLLEPMKMLLLDLIPSMLEIDDEFEISPSKSVSRIYRDIRFSKNKAPYKNTMWITFKRPGKNWHGFPGFFFEITATGFILGMGFYSMSKGTRENFRSFILKKSKEFKRVINFLDMKNNLFHIEGESYKRIPKNVLPELDDDLLSWYKRKSFYIITSIIENNELLYSQKLVQIIKDNFLQIAKFYKFLWKMYEE